MKFIGYIVVFALLFNLSTQINQFVNCPPEIMANSENGCGKITCDGPTSFFQLGCAEFRCQAGKTIGKIDQDNSKLYPSCCESPICAD